MRIRTGFINPNTEKPVQEGLNKPFYCVARIGGESVKAVAKRIDAQRIEAECVCAALMRKWGISVPEPVLLTHQDGSVVFGSLDTDYPNLKHPLGIKEGLSDSVLNPLIREAAEVVCKWDDIGKAMAADELIENGDRNLGNFLWDGGDGHAYIDHERALGLWPFKENAIAVLARLAGEVTKIQMQAATFAYSGETGNAGTLDPEPDMDFMWGVDFIAQRVRTLGEHVLARFPQPVDLFSQNDDT